MIKNLALSVFKSNRDLETFYREKVAVREIRERRASVGICVIDDQPFVPQANLSNYGYKIQPIGDIKSVSEIQIYDLILCDIMGVGHHFDNKLQGASLIAEIKRCHPEKLIVAYTGAALHQVAARQANAVADDLIKKDIDIEDWLAHLDGYTENILNPFSIWERIRFDLIQRGIDTKDIIRLEDAYVSSIENGDRNFTKMLSTVSASGVRDDIRNIVNGLISSAAFHYITGL